MAKKPQLRKQTRAYWQKRSVERTLAAERQALPYIRKARQVYAKSAREVTKQVQDIYAKYYRDNGFDMQALRQLAPQGDIRRLKARMRKLGLETNLPDNYAYRVRRLEMLNMQMRAEVYEAGQKIKQLTGKSLAKTYENGYYRTIYDTAKGIGHTPAFSRLNKETVSKVLDAKNYGKNFSERIWGRSKKLGDELQSIIGAAIATGQSPAKTARLLRERFNVSASSAERLIRTETNYYENQAEIDAYKEMGVGEYQFLATIDTRTSEVCQGHDHKTYKVSEAKVGVNMPPLHPNCRSTITPYFGKEWEPEVRIARNPKTGRNEYISNMSYEEWFGKIADGTIEYIKSNAVILPEVIDITNAIVIKPKQPVKPILIPENVKYSLDELDNARWLSRVLGKDISFVPRSDKKTPDYKLDDGYVELKTPKTNKLNTISKRLREAKEQVKDGVVLLNLSQSQELFSDRNSLYDRIKKDMKRFGISEVIIRNGENVDKAFRLKLK